MNCRELITFLETEVPLETAEGWDNPGFLVGDKEKEIKKIAEEYEFLPGPNPAILALATGLGEQLFGNQMIDGATYCYNIVYGLTGDDKVKELMEGLAKINM